jgi:hypothetical protein
LHRQVGLDILTLVFFMAVVTFIPEANPLGIFSLALYF